LTTKSMRGLGLHTWILPLAVVLLAGGVTRASAQGPNEVAVVVQYGDGSVSTQCVSFDTPTITGLDALQRTGLDVVYEGGALGARVCKIGPLGCDLPGNCFCQCTGTECLYWSYWHLADGTWQYAIVGAASYQVAPGSVEGWSWGIGTPNRAPQPPLITFAEVCAPATATPPPSATPTPSATPRPTETPTPTPAGEQLPSPTPTRLASTPTLEATHTPSPVPAQTPAETPSAEPTALRATDTPTASPAAGPVNTNYIFFGAVVLVLVALGAYVLLRRR
jgi:hypothetical protein